MKIKKFMISFLSIDSFFLAYKYMHSAKENLSLRFKFNQFCARMNCKHCVDVVNAVVPADPGFGRAESVRAESGVLLLLDGTREGLAVG